MEYVVRKELGGYFPENQEKAFFFMYFCTAMAEQQRRKIALEKLKLLAMKGGN